MSLLKFLNRMKHSPLHNYGGVPGVTSWLMGTPGPHGLVRLFECSRDHFEPIIPHSHRFAFYCEVLAGTVRNVIWTKHNTWTVGDTYQSSALKYTGVPGEYEKGAIEETVWLNETFEYKAGDSYQMAAHEVHSIYFSRGASVLFFEGPQTEQSSIILEPFVYGKVVPTFAVPEWAFQPDATEGDQP